MQAIVKAAVPPGEVASTIRRQLQTLDPVLAPGRTERMEALLADSVAQPRFAMLLIGSFAGLALTLTLVGLYGTLAYLVSQRQREFGIRLAMGATRGCIRRMVFRQGLALIAFGVPAGIVLSLFTSRFASAVLLNVQESDPLVLAGVAALLTVTRWSPCLVRRSGRPGWNRLPHSAPIEEGRCGRDVTSAPHTTSNSTNETCRRRSPNLWR
jgi:ABC-type antimicrobial peptide transport system permease subunit